MSPEKQRLFIALKEAQKELPRLRLGQLICNAVTDKRGPLYYLTDAELTQALREYVNEVVGARAAIEEMGKLPET